MAEPPRVLGVESCASVACHNAAEPLPNSSVAQNEYRVWAASDPHARAYKSLSGERGVAMARLAGVGPATEAPLCLSCHTTAQAGAVPGPRLTREEGVSCEACHGAASPWIGPHARGLYHYDEVLAAGLYPTATIAARAAQCLRCHGPDAGVDHGLIAAGHPQLTFDLASYSRLQPAHFVVDHDYRQRKRPLAEAAVWAIGASAVVAKRFRVLGDPARGKTPLFPELSALNCESCHVPIADWPATSARPAAWRPRPILDLSEIPALLAVAAVVAPELADEIATRQRAVEAAAAGEGAFSPAANAFADAIDKLGASVARTGISGPQARTAMQRLPAPDAATSAHAVHATDFALRAFARSALDAGVLPAADALAVSQRLQSTVREAPRPDLAGADGARLRADLAGGTHFQEKTP